MECTADKLLFLIETLRRCNLNATQIHQYMNEAWPKECLSVRTIRRRCQEFKEGSRDSFERKEGSGRPTSDNRNDNVDDVKRLIDGDSCLTLRDIAAKLNISHTIVKRILNEDLAKLWCHTKWVPHCLSDRNKFVRVERCGDMVELLTSRIAKANLITIDEKFFYCRKVAAPNKIGSWMDAEGDTVRRQTARRTNMEKKFLVIVAVSQQGYHYFEVLTTNEHITSDRYVDFLRNLEHFLRQQQVPIFPENMRLQHDNARPHSAGQTSQYLDGRNIRLIRQPPYSPDVNLCDRYIFPRLEALTKPFQSSQEISNFLGAELPKFTAQRMYKALEDAIDHMKKIIEMNGNYI